MLSVCHDMVECVAACGFCVQLMLSVGHTVDVCAVTRSESANIRQTPECCHLYVLMLSVSHDVVECNVVSFIHSVCACVFLQT